MKKKTKNKKSNSVTFELKCCHKVANVVCKGENSGYQHFLIFLQCFQKTFDRLGAYSFCPVYFVYLSVLPAKNFNIGHNFCIKSGTAFIFDICISCRKIFSLVSRSRSSLKVKVKHHCCYSSSVFHKQSLLQIIVKFRIVL